MPWARFESSYPFNKKVAGLSNLAFRIHTSAICLCVLVGADGALTCDQLEVVLASLPVRRGAPSALQELEDAGLFVRDSNGVTVHDFLEYNPGTDQQIHQRQLAAERQRRLRKRRRNAVTDENSNASHANVTSLRHDVPSPPLPSQMEEEEAQAATPSAFPPPPEGCGKCEKYETKIGYNRRSKRPCTCPLGRWRQDHKKSTGEWPVGPRAPATTPARSRHKLDPTLQGELDDLLDQLAPETSEPPEPPEHSDIPDEPDEELPI